MPKCHEAAAMKQDCCSSSSDSDRTNRAAAAASATANAATLALQIHPIDSMVVPLPAPFVGSAASAMAPLAAPSPPILRV